MRRTPLLRELPTGRFLQPLTDVKRHLQETHLMPRETIGRPMEILLVEDNWDDARLAYEFLKDGNIQHRLTWLWDGEEALEFLNRRGKYARVPHPDMILLDLGLPRVDGREVLSEVKADYELS